VPVDDEPTVEPVAEPIDSEEAVVENNEPRPLVPIVLAKIGNQEVNSVSARDLYLDLGMDKSQWSRWFKSNIVENEFFKDGIDYLGFDIMSNGNETRDFAITIEFAKHIAMMAKTQRAHDYRNYFIECEKIAKGETLKVEPKTEKLSIITEKQLN
jgi:anti-repressor protein